MNWQDILTGRQMLKRFAVAHVNFFDNNLVVEIVIAENWRDAIMKHSAFKQDNMQDQTIVNSWLQDIPNTLEEMKHFFYDTDTLIDVKEIAYQ